MEIKDRELYINLYELYSSLLTDKQKSYFEDYYFLDFSLQEIAENNNVSRNACYDAINKTCKILADYESKLKLNEKTNKLKGALDLTDINKVKEVIAQIIEE